MTPRVAEGLKIVAARQPLSRALAEEVFLDLMDGKATEAQKGAILLGIATRGETADEVAGAVAALRARMRRVESRRAAAARHLRSGRPGARPVQPLDGDGDRGGGRGRVGGQAREPLDHVARGVRGRPRGLRRDRASSIRRRPGGFSTTSASCSSSRRPSTRR